MSDAPRDEFFVGYLPMPPRLRRFIFVALAALLVLGAAIAWGIASRLRDPGNGRWMPDDRKSVDGFLLARPYPMLWTGTEMLLLVGDGKFAAKVPDGLADHAVRVTGSIIERPGRRMIEVASGKDGIRALDNPPEAIAHFTPSGAVLPMSLQGEIVDSKCFLGAMKPGDGKTHKACAALCLRGGIPPMFCAATQEGGVMMYLLSGPDLAPITGPGLESLLPIVGDGVEVEGIATDLGDLRVLQISTNEIHRR